MMDIRFSNRWAGFNREEIILFHQAIKWFSAENDSRYSFKELMDEMWAEVMRRDDYMELIKREEKNDENSV